MRQPERYEKSMQFITKFSWEFIQNLPLVGGLMLALQRWQDAQNAGAISAVLIGSLLGVIIIRMTEQKIVGDDRAGLQGSREPVMVTITNFAMMFIIMAALTLYLTANWSSIVTDAATGAAIGFLLSAGQSLAAGRSIGWRHTIAFSAAFLTALIIIRIFSAVLPLIPGILFITTVVTLIITYVDYGHLTTIKEGAN
jgi:hypothetical protein